MEIAWRRRNEPVSDLQKLVAEIAQCSPAPVYKMSLDNIGVSLNWDDTVDAYAAKLGKDPMDLTQHEINAALVHGIMAASS